MKLMHLLFLIEKEEEEDLLLGIPNIFIVKNMATQLNCAGRKFEDEEKKESSFMHKGEKKNEDDTLFL